MIKRKKAFTVMEVLVVAGIFFGMIAALTPFMRMAKVRANRLECANRLREISIGLHAYAAKHRDVFPPDLAALYPEYVANASAFDCPASKTRGTPAKPDYEYTGGLKESSPAEEISVKDADGNHKTMGKNVLRVNGSVDWIAAR